MAKKADVSQSNIGISDFAAFSAEVRSGVIRNAYLFFGEESYLIDKAIEAVARNVLSPDSRAIDMHIIDAKGRFPRVDVLRDQVYMPPFLSPKRLVVMNNPALFLSELSDSELKSLADFFDHIPDTSCVIFVENKIDKRKKNILKALSPNTLLVEISKQKGEDLCRWVATTLKKDSIRISIEAVTSLVDRADNNMCLLENEVKKLVMFCKANQIQEIDLDTIDYICIPDIRGSIFQMSDAIGMRQTEKALEILDRLILLKEPVTKIRFMMARHIRNLICAKEIKNAQDLSSKLKVMPFVARKLTEQSRCFSQEHLDYLYDLCFMTDYNVKKGKIDELTALELLLIRAGNISEIE